MTPANSPLKVHLERLSKIFKHAEKMQPDDIMELNATSARTVLQTLLTLTRQAAYLELELSLLRDSEAGKRVADAAEQLATGHLAGMLDAAGSNIIRPNFGGRNRNGEV